MGPTWSLSDLEAWSLNNVTVPITIQYQVPAELEANVLGQGNQDTEGTGEGSWPFRKP